MKFVHIADMHFDSPFVNLSDRDSMGELRRLEQRKVFKKIIEYIKDNNIEYLFISGDLYEHKYIKQSTIEYINKLFKEIPNTKIYIAPGNHDPYLKNSYYAKFNWNENVKIFSDAVEKIENEDANIYGYGFTDFYCENSGIENIEIEDKDKLNILVIHGALDSSDVEDRKYNPMKKNVLKSKGFDYIALGHIHKLDYNSEENQNIVYPGSTVSLGFDELGQHGMIVGDFEGKNLNLAFVPLDEKEYKIINLDITDINSKEELIEKIMELDISENEYIEIKLKGSRNFEINTYELLKLILDNKIIKIKDETKIAYDLDKLSNETTLRGLFIKEMKEKLNNPDITQEEKEIIEKGIEIGLDVLE